MDNSELMLFLELAFINYNEFAIKHCKLSFFTQTVNSEIVIYSVPESKTFHIPSDLPKILRYVTRHEDDNIFTMDVIDDLWVLVRKIRKLGLADYPQKAVNSINISIGSILCSDNMASDSTKYYRVIGTSNATVELIEIKNRKGRPVISIPIGQSFQVKVAHNAIILDGRLLVKYVHQR